MSPWSKASECYFQGQLDLGYDAISNLEEISMLNIYNFSTLYLGYGPVWAKSKYNPKVYLNKLNSVSKNWNQQQDTTPTNGWPESSAPLLQYPQYKLRFHSLV